MGHERIGLLPRSQRWRDLASRLVDVEDEWSTSDLVDRTLDLVRTRFAQLAVDPGVFSSFEYLTLLSLRFSQAGGEPRLPGSAGINLSDDSTPLEVVRDLRNYLEETGGSAEYSALSLAAAADALGSWYADSEIRQMRLFDVGKGERWRNAGTAEGFCEISRLFFARLTERYLRYFLERAGTEVVWQAESKDTFQERLSSHLDRVSALAFETSKITQSFAAGWFNRRLTERKVEKRHTKEFLRVAFEKLREELTHHSRLG
jgi:hypothetical protein